MQTKKNYVSVIIYEENKVYSSQWELKNCVERKYTYTK